MGEGPTAQMRQSQWNGKEENVEEFWGDEIEHRDGSIRIVYNNCDGMQIKDFLRNMAVQKSAKIKSKMIKSPIEVSKVGQCVGLLRTWDANLICLAETQTAWEIKGVTSAVTKEVKRIDQYGGMIGSSSALATSSGLSFLIANVFSFPIVSVGLKVILLVEPG